MQFRVTFYLFYPRLCRKIFEKTDVRIPLFVTRLFKEKRSTKTSSRSVIHRVIRRKRKKSVAQPLENN